MCSVLELFKIYHQHVKFSENNFLQTLGENYWEILFALESRENQKDIEPLFCQNQNGHILLKC